MAKLRLLNSMRVRITNHIIAYSFDALEKEQAINEDRLFHKAVEYVFNDTDLAKVARLKDHWFPSLSRIKLNAGGWIVNLNALEGTSVKVPYRAPRGDKKCFEDYHSIVEAPDFLKEVQDHASAGKDCRDKKNTMRHALGRLLAGCRTLEAFYDAMPEAEEILKDLVIAKRPANNLMVAGQQILCMVASVRGENRPGCKDSVFAGFSPQENEETEVC